jgi:hypothetical protein
MSDKQLDWRNNIIRDGFTQRAYIAEDERLHGELRFNYRPMLPEEVGTMDNFMAQYIREPVKVNCKICQVCAEKIIDWSEELDGKPLAISENSLRRLRPQLLTKLYNVISGSRPSDEDPLHSQHDDLDSGVAPLTALQEGTVMEQLGKS